jgi:hypothetical protein
MAQRVYSIACECGTSYVGDTMHTSKVRLHEHKQISKKGLNWSNIPTKRVTGYPGIKLGFGKVRERAGKQNIRTGNPPI